MADNGPYEIPGFQRRRPRRTNHEIPHQSNTTARHEDSAEVIVISSGDEDDTNTGNGYPIQIKTEDIKPNLPIEIFDPTKSPTPSGVASFTNLNATQWQSTPNQETQRIDRSRKFRMIAAKSTTPAVMINAAVRFPTSNQAQRPFSPDYTAPSSTRNETRLPFTPNYRESVLTKLSTPESGFVDQLVDDYQSDFEQDYMPPPHSMKTVWSTSQTPKRTNINVQPVERPSFKNPIPPEQLTLNENHLHNNQERERPNVLEPERQSSKTPIFDTKVIKCLENLVHKTVSDKCILMPKKESDHEDETQLLVEMRSKPSTSSSSMCESESDVDSYKSNHQRTMQKRCSNAKSTSRSNKSRKLSDDFVMSSSSIASSDSYRPDDDCDEDDGDDDDDELSLDSTFSRDTQVASTSHSPQYEPESDLDYEYESGGDSDEMESEGTPSSASSEYEPELYKRSKKVNIRSRNTLKKYTPTGTDTDTEDDNNELLLPHQRQRNTDKSLYWKSTKAQTCPLCNKKSIGRMVLHFKSDHKNSEVFVSRISQKMVDDIKNGKLSLKKDKRSYNKSRSNSTIQTVCVFCEQEKNFPINYWVDHIRSHTGEFGNSCSVCNERVSFNNHCGRGTIKRDDFDLRNNNMYAYRCVDCNFVQTHFKNIERHLRVQHQVLNIDQTVKPYEKFILLPAYNRITEKKPDNPRGAQSQDLTRKSDPQKQPIECQPHAQRHASIPSTSGRTSAWKNVSFEPEIVPKRKQQSILKSLYKVQAQRSLGSTTTNPSAIEHAMKNDPGDEEILLSVHEEYKALEKSKKLNKSLYTVNVRPWILEDYAQKRIIITMTQYALYKCMHPWCMYATNSDKDWETHMERHIQLMDALNKRNLINNNNRSELIKFRECPYCGSEAQNRKHSSHQVCHHMEMQHSRNTLQCTFCFYRTPEIDNMIFHMRNYHPNAGREILVYDVHREFQQKDEEILRDGCDQYITKMKCGQDKKCTKQFVCYNALYAHHVTDHSAKVLQCPYCRTQMKCTKSAMQEHLTQMHGHRQFQEFQCFYCEMGYDSVEQIRHHMAESHQSQFLFVGARWNCNTVENATDEIQVLYIGDAEDYSKYKLYTCSNFDALNSMDPRELSPSKQFQKLIQMQNTKIKTEYHGRLPSISYTFTKKFANEKFITLERYWKSHPGKTNSTFSSKQSAQQQQKKAAQLRPSKPMNLARNVAFPKHRNTHQAVQSINFTNSANLSHLLRPDVLTERQQKTAQFNSSKPMNLAHNVAFSIDQKSANPSHLTRPDLSMKSIPATLTPSVKYICITDKQYEDLITINETERPSRQCHLCNWPKRINNNRDLCAYVDHFIHKHPCENLGKMPNIQAVQNHRLKYHKRQPLVCLKVRQSNSSLTYELFKFRYECQKCEQRFDTHNEIDLHFFTKHPTIPPQFHHQKIVEESTVLRID